MRHWPGAIGGALVGALKGKTFVFGGSGLFSLASRIDPSGDPANFVSCCIGVAVAMVAVFIIQ